MLTQGGQGGRPAPLALRFHRIPTHFPLNLRAIYCKLRTDGRWLTGSYHPRSLMPVLIGSVVVVFMLRRGVEGIKNRCIKMALTAVFLVYPFVRHMARPYLASSFV